MGTHMQPLLNDLLVAFAAPTQAWSGQDGQIGHPDAGDSSASAGAGAQGLLHSDVRMLSSAYLTVSGAAPEPLLAFPDGHGSVRTVGVARNVDGPGADPTTRLERRRTVTPGRMSEAIELSCVTDEPVTAVISIRLGADLASMEDIKSGHETRLVPAVQEDELLVWRSATTRTSVSAPGARIDFADPHQPIIHWSVTVANGSPVQVQWSAEVTDDIAVVHAPHRLEPEWTPLAVTATDRRLDALVKQSMTDLHGLRMVSVRRPDDVFLAAGAPWFFTMFGRDSLWAARLLLPAGTKLAAGTLRALAAFQGSKEDPQSAEQPGKIPHEIRRATLTLPGEGLALPPVYYGTVDATPLWVTLLHDAWRWGMPEEEVEALLPALEAALGWVTSQTGDGFLQYIDRTGHGLSNQGWKDSGDSIQFRNGRLAEGPIALAEVQAYAYEAAMAGAAILDHFQRPGAERLRIFATGLAGRFRSSFWLEDDFGPYPGIALDGAGDAVDIVSSNMGHLLGTGILSPEESALIAGRLVHPEINSGFGLRTMATSSEGYWPLKYHGGAVWSHDTAICMVGLAKDGHTSEAAQLAAGLLNAAESFQYRLPELHGGDSFADIPTIISYPAACRPQAWSAASAVAIIQTLLGLQADVPAGTLTVNPTETPVGAIHAAGLCIAGHRFSITSNPSLSALGASAPAGLRIISGRHDNVQLPVGPDRGGKESLAPVPS